jgi:hypothetical protein
MPFVTSLPPDLIAWMCLSAAASPQSIAIEQKRLEEEQKGHEEQQRTHREQRSVHGNHSGTRLLLLLARGT